MKLLDEEEIINNSIYARKNGVYFLIENNEIVYVGSTVNFLQRFSQHYKLNLIKFDSYYFIETENFREIEKCYIWKFNPKYNQKNKKDIIFNRYYDYKGFLLIEDWLIKCSIVDKIIKKYILENNLPINYDLELSRLKNIAKEEINIEIIDNNLYYDYNGIAFIMAELFYDYNTEKDEGIRNTHDDKIAKIIMKYIYGE